jgi:hypothetical protein
MQNPKHARPQPIPPFVEGRFNLTEGRLRVLYAPFAHVCHDLGASRLPSSGPLT